VGHGTNMNGLDSKRSLPANASSASAAGVRAFNLKPFETGCVAESQSSAIEKGISPPGPDLLGAIHRLPLGKFPALELDRDGECRVILDLQGDVGEMRSLFMRERGVGIHEGDDVGDLHRR